MFIFQIWDRSTWLLRKIHILFNVKNSQKNILKFKKSSLNEIQLVLQWIGKS